MKFREIKRRIHTESAFLNPITLGISAGASVLLGALCATGFITHPASAFFPRTALPSFLHILLQLIAYAALGAAFASLLHIPLCRNLSEHLRLRKNSALLLLPCILVLCYVWIPTVCRARSFFLGTLLCGVILVALVVLMLLTWRISLICAGLAFVSSLWMIYILYVTLTLLFFA